MKGMIIEHDSGQDSRGDHSREAVGEHERESRYCLHFDTKGF